MASASSPLFLPIPETDMEEEEDDDEGGGGGGEGGQGDELKAPAPNSNHRHTPTPLHPASSSSKPTPRTPRRSVTAGDLAVSCNRCRPSSRDKTTVVPLDPQPSPNRLLRSLLPSLRRTPAPPADDFRLAAAELSRKLGIAVRQRDEALLESSGLKSSLSSLSRKLDRLESHCLDLQSALDRCSPSHHTGSLVVDPFLRAVSDSRAAVRQLAASLFAHIRPAKSLDRLAVESLLNRVFYADFELGFGLGSDPEPLDPVARCELNQKRFESVRDLGWEAVLSRGTRHYSEGLSRFCDRTMGEVVGMLGWGAAQRAWPEGLLRAFFGAAKGVWMVHSLARSVHPALPILRVGPGAKFEPEFMEDVSGSGREGQPVSVRVMVAPGFYVYSARCGVVKCKVLGVYDKSNNKKHRQDRHSSGNNSGRSSNKRDSRV